MLARPLLAAIAVLLVAAPLAAADERGHTIYQSRHLWATINVCDPPSQPDVVGVRGSMPGSGRRGERMWMRFIVQYRSAEDGLWHNFLLPGTDSGWVRVGHARYRARQSGWEFPFRMSTGTTYELRGVVAFEWRRGDRVVRRARKRTTAGHKVSIADPEGYSEATCLMAGG